MRTTTLQLSIADRGILPVTPQLRSFAAECGTSGLLHAFLPHATCGLALIEVGAGSDADLLTALDELLPRDDRWRHRHGSVGHGADHVLPAFVSPSLVLPVDDGALVLGTWQSVVVVDPNADNPSRMLRLSFVGA